MKLCISTLACPAWSFPQIVGAAAAHGIEGIDPRGIGPEIDITRLDIFNDELPATIELLRRHNLSMPCLNTSITLVTPAAERWQMMLDDCQRHARLAGGLSSHYLRIFGGAVPKGMTRAEAVVLAQRHLRQLIKICSTHACQVVLETHDDWATSDQVLELLDGFSPSEAGVLWDIEHPFRHGESPAKTAMALKKHIRHIHFKDSAHRDGRNLPRLLGEGELPLGECIAALRRIDYNGWICLETEKRWHPEDAPDPEQSLPQFAEYMGEHWG